MKQITFNVLFLVLIIFGSCSDNSVSQEVESIRINSLGYTPEGNKITTIVAAECDKIVVKNATNNKKVFEVETTGPFSQIDTLIFWKADFSSFKDTGKFYIEVPGVGRSIEFMINNEVNKFPYYTSMRAFYLWRCGTEVFGVHKGDTFAHAACHLEDGYLDFTGLGKGQKDGTGGWHDAGDYGKYVTNAGITVANLLMAWEHFSDKIENISLDIPETSPEMPDFLEEVKWEIDYLLKMEYPDGSGKVSHKLTRKSFSAFMMPEDDHEKRYFTDWGTNAVANFSAVLAKASRIFEPYNPEYAQTCLEASKRAYTFLEKNKEPKFWRQREFSTGGYQARDKGTRLWAAAEMWETTGDKKYLKDFETQAQTFENKIDLNWDWGNLMNLGMFTYLQSEKEGKTTEIYSSIKDELFAIADTIVNNTKNDVFGRPFDRYYWGCNGTVARLSITLGVANAIEPSKEYEDAAQSTLAHLFGVNYYNRSYVTGLGINPPMNPHSRRSGADNVEAPWPGYLVGGGHTPTDWVDKEESYSHNEIAINWQAPLVYVLAWFLP